MSATLFRKEKIYIDSDSFVQIVIWEVDPPVKSSHHTYKYRMVYVHNRVCMLRYDNEAGKGDHKHIGNAEVKTVFDSIEQLVSDFFGDVDEIRRR